MSSISRPRTSFWTALRQHIALERELSLYTSESDLNDLHDILDRYSDKKTAHIRRVLSRHAV